MDRIESLGNTLSQITLYDIKTMYNQAKNVVLNVSEMESKVREATNDDPWGASSTLMQEIAQGTFNFQQFNEIMPSIYSRFMEKEARQWRQIYKSLQLLEYLVKNGSERVVDDARSHLSTIKMLRSFYHVDDKGKDQGINIRNRAKEIVDLLSDVENIRAERRKAKANKSKYVGTGNDGGWGMSSPTPRYGGFGNDSIGGSGYGGGSNYDADYEGNYGGGDSSYSGGGGGAFRDDAGRRGFQEYDAGDDETVRRSNSTSRAARSPMPSANPPRSAALPMVTQPATKQKEPVKEVDLLGFGDDDSFTNNAPALSAAPGIQPLGSPPAVAAPAHAPAPAIDDDDFDDFQAAPPPASATNRLFSPPTVQTTASPPVIQPQVSTQPNLFLDVGVLSPTSPRANTAQPSSAVPNYGFKNLNTSSPMLSATPSSQTRSNVTSQASAKPTPVVPAKSGGNFDDLWNLSLGSKPVTASTSGPAKTMKDLEKEKASAGIWGASTQQQGKSPAMGTGLGGSSFGGFGSSAPSTSTSGGVDDLLF